MAQRAPAANFHAPSHPHRQHPHLDSTQRYPDETAPLNEADDDAYRNDSDLHAMSSPPRPPPHANLPQPPSAPYRQHHEDRQYGIAPGSSYDGSQGAWRPSPTRNSPPRSHPSRNSPPRDYDSRPYYGADSRNHGGAGPAAAGGMAMGAGAGVAMGASHALQDIDNWGRSGHGVSGAGHPPQHQQQHMDYDSEDLYGDYSAHPRAGTYTQVPSRSNEQLAGAGGMAMGMGAGYGHPSPYGGGPADPTYPARSAAYQDNPYRHSSYLDPRTAEMGGIDPSSIEDDGDDGLHANPARRSVLSLGRTRGGPGSTGSGGAAGAALAAPKAFDASGSSGHLAGGGLVAEKSGWLEEKDEGKKKRKRLLLSILVVVVIIVVIAGAVAGGILGSQAGKGKGGSGSSSSGGTTAAEDDGRGDLGKNSKEIKALLNNPDLHRVFPGVDYTPLHSQYPDCLHFPPSQNNVTRDMAVLSQLTKSLRMYGTDCNQTQMVLHAIERLELKDMKVWLGVWLDKNATTNARQMAQMWDILDEYGADHFDGVVIGNEVLFREDMTESQLGQVLGKVKTDLASKGYQLPVATSDLGSKWTTTLASYVDVVMANIHPFFGGVPIDEAAGWTWDFWQNNDVPVTAGTGKRNIVSEVGWPSAGGNNCGANVKCQSKTVGSVAGIDEMNRFMEDWVCQALKNGTEYYWFEAFDEPWKVMFNTEDEQWEDKWGLMDVNRNLKPGVKIPDCDGQSV